jgi:membrane-bound lytic murein transglycosylase D
MPKMDYLVQARCDLGFDRSAERQGPLAESCGPGPPAIIQMPPMRTLKPTLALIVSLTLPPIAASATVGAADGPTTFPRPPSLAPAVSFWTRVYTEVDTNSGFIHDNLDLAVIYQVLRLNPYVTPAVQDKVIERTVDQYRRALLALATGKRYGLTKTELRALQAWQGKATADALRAAAERVRFQRGQSNRFKKGLVRSRRWRSRINDIFRAQGLPTELAALPHLESSYNPEAHSKAGAAGLWQLMPTTAERYLRVDDAVDERLDPYKSTVAAARLLQHDYAVLKSWPLALTAYNHGLSGVWRAVSEAGTNDIGQLIGKGEGSPFGFASRNFYPAFLAALDVSRNATTYFGDDLTESDADPVTVVVPAYLPVEAITEAYDIDREYLRALNPSLPGSVWSDDKFVPKDYQLRLPAHQPLAEAEHRLQELIRTAGYASQKPDVYHIVQPGESLSVIAQKCDKSVLELMAMNRLKDRDRIRAGDKLLVATGPAPERLSGGSQEVAAVPFNPTAGAAATPAAEPEAGVLNGGGNREPATGILLMASVLDDLDFALAPAPAQSPQPETGSGEHTPPTLPQPKPPETMDEGVTQDIPADGSDGSPQTADAQAGEGAGLPVEPQPELAADPADYSVSRDGTIRIQAAETLGHYADWLGLRSDRLAQINHLKDGEPLVVGRRLKLDFSKVPPDGFEKQRIAYHRVLQASYFRRFHVQGIREHRIKDGESLWILAIRQYDIPLWLLRQYNPSIDLDSVLPPGEVISIPIVQG